MTDLKGKWVLITGASRGIGRLVTELMAEQGCNLILQSRSVDHTADIAEDIRNKGLGCYSVECDLNDIESVNEMLAKIDNLGVTVDVVLNNAGLQIAYRKDFCLTPPEDYTISFNVNTIAPAMICYHFLPGMIERGFGRIVNTTSGIDKEPEQAGYSAAKAALDKITKDMASKLPGTGVTMNLTDPGWCRTDLGGPNAPNAPESALPGVVAAAFCSDKVNGVIVRAQKFSGMTLEEAVAKLEA
ncbi:Short-chain dehydrogenase [Ruminococcaceae bacterium YRB3002]|nr:Short-chain dehydrogenase [Ruminococcaceae bacterium YRB3002]